MNSELENGSFNLILARHGESEANIINVFSNRLDQYGLTPIGKYQVGRLSDGLREKYTSIGRVVCSPLKRAQETARIVAAQFGVAYAVEPNLIEFDVGELKGRADQDSWIKFDQLYIEWFERHNHASHLVGGESLEDIISRMQVFFDEVRAVGRCATSFPVLAIGHGGTLMSSLPFLVEGLDPEFFRANRFGHCDYIELSVMDSGVEMIDHSLTPNSEWKPQKPLCRRKSDLHPKYEKITPNDQPEYRGLISSVSESVWPEFMFHDPIADEHWDGLFEKFPSFQFALINRENQTVAGIANSVPLLWEGVLKNLPDEGWDWALIKSASDHAEGILPNVLCGIQISISPEFQGRGLSRVFLREMVNLAGSNGFNRVIVPVRPSLKDRYPLTTIASYINWKTEEELPFDPWLRVHVRNGGRIVKPCPLAMRIIGRIAEWEDWTGLRFFESGEYIIPGALVPVRINLGEDLGEYVEPNVWVVHEAG